MIVTEDIPGAGCVLKEGGGPEHKKYECTIQPGFGSVMFLLKGLIRYTTFIVALVGVLMLVVSGVQYSIAGIDEGMKAKAKERIFKVIGGISVLFLLGMILNTVAPWVYR